jgi:hypothetical protein
MIPSCHAGTNLAFHKTYTLTPRPSYSLTAPDSDITSLTDGKYSVGHFWSQKSTVGWVYAKRVNILIDLEKVSIIDGISFSTAHGTRGGSLYPEKIDAFIGPDVDHLLYTGDLAKGVDLSAKSYETKHFKLNGIGVKGRYVLLIVQAQGPYVFCDEIEVYEGTKDTGKSGNLTMKQAREMPLTKTFFFKLVEEIKLRIVDSTVLMKRLAVLESSIESSIANLPDIVAIEKELYSIRRDILLSNYPGKELLVTSQNLWSSLAPTTLIFGTPLEVSSLVLPIGGYDHAALLVTNLAPENSEIDVSVTLPGNAIASVSRFEVPFIRSAAMEYVPDPMKLLTEPFILRSGESRMIAITAMGQRTGAQVGLLKIRNRTKIVSIPIQINVTQSKFPKIFSLNSMPWAYLSYPLTHNRIDAVLNDLAAHHTNTFVVPPAYLPKVNSDKDFDFKLMKENIDPKYGVDKIMLFMNLAIENNKSINLPYRFMDEKWQASFRKWYKGALAAVAEKGFSSSHLYLYPYDEMHDKEIDQFIDFAVWVRKEFPNIKLYGTLGWKNSERALLYLDVAQISNSDKILEKFYSNTVEKWLYGGDGTPMPAKSMSPYTHYRLIAWKAFLKGYKGIGFWSYADSGWGTNPGSAWDDFDGLRPDYTVIYEGDGESVISSRRWEAWRMGIEDYELLVMYAKTKGNLAANILAKSVLDAPNDTFKADQVRHKILEELSSSEKK